MSSDAKIYCQYMEEIKQRISVIRNFISNINNVSFGNDFFNYEFVCIHLRKILELIVFSTLAANKEEYSRIYEDYARKWNTKKLLSSIGKINPEFYPKPVKLGHVDANGVKHFENIKSGYLRKNDWEKLYDLCSKVLHVWNPYEKNERHLNFESTVIEWVENIQSLLGMHYVQILKGRKGWFIIMEHPEDGKVHAFLYE